MAVQEKLFHEAPIAPRVARRDPRLWVRRIIIWERPGEPLREIRLRRGLNIVWSPDPGAQAAAVGTAQGIGHGAGKTLFCRLIRYCLGEETFADDELRARIASALPEGLVGAEIIVDGITWGVLRPLGSSRRNVVAEGRQPEELLDNDEHRGGMKPLLDLLQNRLMPEKFDEHVPGTKEGKAWLLALAWLTRDQDCRFGHLLEWRHTRSESRSTATSIGKDQLLLIVRALLGGVATVEMELQAQQAAAATSKKQGEQDIQYFNRTISDIGPELTNALGFDLDVLAADNLALAAMQKRAKELLQEAQEHFVGNDENEALAPLRDRLNDLAGQKAVIREKRNQAAALKDLKNAQIRALNGESANLSAEALKARLGPVCPICNVGIDEALARGCGLSHKLPDLEQIKRDKREVDQQLANARAAIELYDRQIAQHDTLLQTLEAEEGKIRNQIGDVEQRGRQERLSRQREWAKAAQLVENTQKLARLEDARARARDQVNKATKDENRLRQDLKERRGQEHRVTGRLSELFGYVCKGILGTNAANLTLTGQGLRAELDRGGTAIESLKVIAFDLAALLMSVEGKRDMPAFLIHDSPREADLGLSLYHKYLRIVRDLEKLDETPPFQYIVTTTTEPPEELCSEPHLILKLSGSVDEERLLKRALT